MSRTCKGRCGQNYATASLLKRSAETQIFKNHKLFWYIPAYYYYYWDVLVCLLGCTSQYWDDPSCTGITGMSPQCHPSGLGRAPVRPLKSHLGWDGRPNWVSFRPGRTGARPNSQNSAGISRDFHPGIPGHHIEGCLRELLGTRIGSP